jgi:SAM-dependent methyltransferase
MAEQRTDDISVPFDPRGPEYEYLCVEEFLKDAVRARALSSALELGVIDHLAGRPGASRATMGSALRIDRAGADLLCDLLAAGGVIEERQEGLRLSDSFRRALKYRDLLEAKLDFTALTFPDYLGGLTPLLAAPDEFRRRAHIFRLFDYGRCYDASPDNLARARRWMRITTTLTKYEAGACLAAHDFGRYRRLLDIGGNSGEFALRICKAHLALRATVFDLPLVCQIGQEHVRREPEAGRIEFVPGSALTDPVPGGFDVITFKSMLHDWPDREAQHLIGQASRSLAPGGTLLIFERGPLEIGAEGVPYSLIPFLLFFRSFRSPVFYADYLEALGFREVAVRRIDLEMPFFVATGVKGP